ncbi:MAG: DNA polymerase II [Candidatus Rokubacteria bacterium]|nr:DNA polymerase II [Candidatus Rokubacteria bacterium]
MALPPLPFHENTLLFGHDQTLGLLAFELEGSDKIRVFRRQDGRVVSDLEPFSPFLLLADADLLKTWKGEAQVTPLDGPGTYRWLARFPSWALAAKARDHCQKASGKTPTAPDAPYRFLNDAVLQFLLLTGKTSFLGLVFADLRRLALDIEVFTAEGFEFPHAARLSDRIIAIAMADSTGWERVISGRETAEGEMLEECSRLIRERDPDVIEGHNIFRFDLEYLEARAKRFGIELRWGRDGSPLRGHPSRMQVAERAISYRRYQITGRHIVDTWILVQHYDVGARDLESYGLKEVARHFGLAAPDRTYLPPQEIPRIFNEDPERLMAYALDDVRETLGVGRVLSQSYFVQAQMFPFDYQDVILKGNATKIDALLLREHLHRRRAVPAPSAGSAVAGGYTAVFYQGVTQRVLHVDVASLYPSLMLTFGIFPEKDALGILPLLLRDLREFRLAAKALAREAPTEEERAYAGALQQTFKILINSFYGYLGFSMGRWNDFGAANRVTAEGRTLIRQVVAALKDRGATVIEIDTDGIYFVAPPDVTDASREEALVAEISRGLPPGISLELDGRYPAMFSYKMKNYVLLNDRDRLTIKGSALRSRGIELFQRTWMEEMFRLLLTGRRAEIPALVQRYLDDFAAHRIPVKQFMKTETLQDSLETYRDKVREGKRNPSAPYELALQSERPYQPGDQVSYYVTGQGLKVKVNEAAKLATQWDPTAPDENVEFYQAKLRELWERFRPLVEPEGLVPIREEAEERAPAQLTLGDD